MAQEKSNFDRWEPLIAKDQFGRKWESIWDSDAKGTCAPINPRGWVDPLNTPQKYVRVKTDEDRQRVIFVDLERWELDLEEAHRIYDQKLYNDAVMLFGERGPDAYAEKAPALMHFTGPGPQSIELVQAARDENPWALGKTLTPDSRLVKYLPSSARARPSFKGVDPAALEEEHDKDALGGKKQSLGKGKRLQEA